MANMNTFIQNDANKKTMPEVAAMVPEFNTAVNTYIATAVKQLDMRIQNRPKEEEFVKNIDELISKAADFRTNVRRMINNAETPEEAIIYFVNYDRISNISIDMANIKNDFSNAVAYSNLQSLLHIEPILKEINTNLSNIRDSLNNRNLINNITTLVNDSTKLINDYNYLKNIYTEMQNIAVSRTESLKTMEQMIEKVKDAVNNITKISSAKSAL